MMVFAGTCALAGDHVSGLPPASEPVAPSLAGQSMTLLPDGRWLAVGGDGLEGPQSGIGMRLGALDEAFPASLHFARSGHTATVLPDGRVLILGGTGVDGRIVLIPEVIDPLQGSVVVLDATSLTARTQHSATLLTDGNVLIVGGRDAQGNALSTAELFNPRTGAVQTTGSGLQVARYAQEAALLANGEGLVWGGQSGSGQRLNNGEIYRPSTQLFEGPVGQADTRIIDRTVAAGQAPNVADTVPSADAADVSLDAVIGIRFTKAVPMAQLSSQNISLVGPSGAVAGTVAGAGRGMLAFFTPSQELTPGATYTLFITGVADEAGRTMPLTTVRFTARRIVAASPEAGSNTGSDSAGRSTSSRPSTATSAGASGATGGASSSARSLAQRASQPKTDRTPGQSPAAAQPANQQAEQAQTTDARVDSSVAEDWVPRVENRHGMWRVLGFAGDPKLAAASVTPLSSRLNGPGVSGVVRRLNGLGLPGVSVGIGTNVTHTDAQGRFLLTGVPTGAQELKIDGRGVWIGGRHYTEHYLHVDIGADSVTPISDPIYLPRVDPATEVSISSPADHDIVLTHPAMPGLEVRIPKGAVLRERDGTVVTKVSLTPIPVDRAPYPAPTQFSVYFTLQPGGAYVDGDPGKAIKVVYPNYPKFAPGVSVDFWNYDLNAGGWQIYGHGRVTAQGKQILADESVGFRQIMSFGFGLAGQNPLPPPGPTPCGCDQADPVDAGTGLFSRVVTDLAIQDVIPITATRVYRTNDNQVRTFGVGANLSYDMWLYSPGTTAATQNTIDLIRADGSRIHFVIVSTDHYQAAPTPTEFAGSVITADETLIQWVLTLRDGTVMRFDGRTPAGQFTQINQLTSITDRHGNKVTVAHLTSSPVPVANATPVTRVTSPNGRYIQFFYDSLNRVSSTMDSGGRTTSYTYDILGRLASATDAAGNTENYAYDPVSNNMSVVTDKRGNTATQNLYDANGRVSQQTLADGAVWQFAYTLDNSGTVTQTNVTDPRGYVTQYSFNPSGYPLQAILALGKPEQQTYLFTRDPANRPLSSTDTLGRVTVYGYDSVGDLALLTLLSGTPGAVSYTLTYDPIFHRLTGVTDPLGHTFSVAVDRFGNPARLTDALGNQTRASFNGQGMPTGLTDALGYSSQFTFSQLGDLLSVVDPLSRRVQFTVDALGRRVAVTDPLGNKTQYGLDALDRVTSVVNAMGGTTALHYDANGNLLSMTDPNNVTQTYTYDGRNRRHTYEDPAGHVATYAFDGMGNLTSVIDRKGQTTSVTYDGIGRPTLVTYQDGSTVSITWDAGDRPTQFVDSANGTVSRTYDLLDRLTQETSPQGQVNYTYDAAGRRTTLTVAGQPAVIYTFDDANRLTQVAQGSTVLGFGYDADGRRTSVTLPNGIVGTFSFDVASQLSSIAYANGSTPVGSLAYGYDGDGRVTSVSGTLAGFVPPGFVPAATHDNSNRLTSWGGAPLTYDANGNLTSLGSSTYTWNARNQLVGTSAGGASFAYDALGRRVSATVNGSARSYVYDGINPVAISGNLQLGSPNVDDVFARVGPAGTTSFLRDGLGSTVGESGSAGGLDATYLYSPYGDSANSGSAATPLQFTGRENDAGTGLYYYRARYYSPQLGRFISEDPLGVAAGTNVYAYVNGNPIGGIDPLGLWALSLGGYAGPGGEVTFGFDDGHFFLTSRVGFGLGVVVEYDPNHGGGIPGGTEATGCRGGAVLSLSAKGGLGFGPLFNASFQGGAYNNVASNIQNLYGEAHANIVNLEPNVLLAEEGFSANISIGVQITLYKSSGW
jgi:RHS repeat-associated protein